MGRLSGSASVFLAVGLLVAACVASAAGQAVPVEGGPFNNLTEAQLSFRPPTGVDIKHRNFVGKSPKDSAGFQAADVQEVIMSLEPCHLFAPHLLPNATEIAVGEAGIMDLYVLLNGKLLHQALKPLAVQIIPQGHVHFLINNHCKQAIIASTETSATPGACFYLDVPGALLHARPAAPDIEGLVATHVSNCSGLAAQAFNKLQNDCAMRCGLLPHTPAALTPAFRFIRTMAPAAAKFVPGEAAAPTATAPPAAKTTTPSSGNGY